MADIGHAYEWLVVVGAIGAFLFGFATGANDVANAFGTSVGAKTLKLWQAVIIAAVFEFTGALVLGRVVTNTIAGGIADINAFLRTPEVYAYGMCCALFVGAFWQILASYLELNVSATHSIIGAILGFAFVHAGKNGVIWARRKPGSFPPYEGVVSIVLAWFVSPVLTGACAALIFLVTRTVVLRRHNAYILSFYTLPPFVLVTTWINVYFILTKGARKMLTSNDSSWTDAKAAWIAAVTAGGLSIFTAIVICPLLKRRVDRVFDEDGNRKIQPKDAEAAIAKSPSDAAAKDADLIEPVKAGATVPPLSLFGKAKKAALHGLLYDIHEIVEEDKELSELHGRAEVFPPRVEMSFSYLQVFSACCVIFAHGAGEVGYMAGPLTTIWYVYKNGFLTKSSNSPIWIILIGALGLVIGLATYGYKVTRAMGVRLAKISPTRGFAAELATALIITIAAQYGLPTSSSQCITGAIIGVGITEGLGGVNWKQFAKQFIAWMCTLAVVGLCTAGVFAQGIYAPSEVDGKQVIQYEDRLVNISNTISRDLNSTLYAFRAASQAGALPRLSAADWSTLNNTLSSNIRATTRLVDVKYTQTLETGQLLAQLQRSLNLLQNYTISTLGQSSVFNGATQCTPNQTAAIQANELGFCRAPVVTNRAFPTTYVRT